MPNKRDFIVEHISPQLFAYIPPPPPVVCTVMFCSAACGRQVILSSVVKGAAYRVCLFWHVNGWLYSSDYGPPGGTGNGNYTEKKNRMYVHNVRVGMPSQ